VQRDAAGTPRLSPRLSFFCFPKTRGTKGGDIKCGNTGGGLPFGLHALQKRATHRGVQRGAAPSAFLSNPPRLGDRGLISHIETLATTECGPPRDVLDSRLRGNDRLGGRAMRPRNPTLWQCPRIPGKLRSAPATIRGAQRGEARRRDHGGLVRGTRWWRDWLTLAPSCTATTERGPLRGRPGILLPAFVATKEEKD
jgi:hypothetical protein